MMSFEDAFDSNYHYVKTDSTQWNCLCTMFKNEENQSILRFYVGILCRIYEVNVILLITGTKVRKLPSFKVYAGWRKTNSTPDVGMQFTAKSSNVRAQTRSIQCHWIGIIIEMSHGMIKPRWHVNPAKTQIRLGGSVQSSLCALWVAENPLLLRRTAETLIRLGGCPGWSVIAGRTGHFVGFEVCWFKPCERIKN